MTPHFTYSPRPVFRASGTWPQKRLEGYPMPYPIFLGYAVSHDNGGTWELEGRFKTPCLFSCGGIVVDGELIVSCGDADEKIGIARVPFDELVDYVRRFDERGRKTG